RQGREVGIFSSGSVPAQQLLFTYSNAGDLTPAIHGYFDTTTGPKQEARSYRCIADALGRSPAEILFVSDIGSDLHASREAGMSTALCVRSEPPAETGAHAIVHSFEEVFPD